MNTVNPSLLKLSMDKSKRYIWKLYDMSNNLLCEQLDKGYNVEASFDLLKECFDSIAGSYVIVKLYDEKNVIDEKIKQGTNSNDIMTYRVSLINKSSINDNVQASGNNIGFIDKYHESLQKIADLEKNYALLQQELKFKELEEKIMKKYDSDDDGTKEILKGIAGFIMGGNQPAVIGQPVNESPVNSNSQKVNNNDLQSALLSIKNSVGLDAIPKVANWIEKNPEQAKMLLNNI